VDDTARITLACLDLAGTSVADGGVVEKAFAEALATQGVVRGTEAYGRSMARVQAARGQSKLDIFREIFSDDDRARAANHSFERAYDSIIDRDGLTPIPGAEAAMDKLTGAGVRVCLMTGFGRHPGPRHRHARLVETRRPPDLPRRRRRPRPPVPGHDPHRGPTPPGRERHHIAVCGDTASDMRSGHRAGASIVAGVLTGAHDRAQLEAAGATEILESISGLPDLILRTTAAVPAPR
jgi:Predicted phosphatases